MKRILYLSFLFSVANWRRTFQYPAGVILFLIGKAVRFILFFAFILFLLKNTKTLAGYSLNETLVFFLTFNIIDSLTQLLFRAVYMFRPLVVSGDLDSILVKPYHPFLSILVGGIDILDFIMLIFYIALAVFFITAIKEITFIGIVLYIALILNALIIASAFYIAVISFGILFIEVDNTIMIYRDITRLGSLPIDIYKEPLRSIFIFVVPVGIMMSAPVKGLLGILQPSIIIYAFVYSTIGIILSMNLWKFALKRYQSWGG